MRNIIKPLFMALAATGLGLAVLLVVYNGTGKETWLGWKAEREAQGDRYEWSSLVSPPVPDEDNFALAPLVRGAVLGKDLDPRFKSLEIKAFEKGEGDWRQGRRYNLQACRDALKPRTIDEVLEDLAPALADLDRASRRTGCRIPVEYAEWEIPGLLGFRGAARTLRFRALYSFEHGDTEQALQDVLTILRLAKQFQKEPSLVASLLTSSLVSISLPIVWEGTRDHRWDDRQLRDLESALLSLDVLASMRLGWEAERLNMVSGFRCTAEGLPTPKGVRTLDEKPKQYGRVVKGWWYRNILVFDQYISLCHLDALDPARHRVHPERWMSAADWLKQYRFRKDLIPGQIAVPALDTQTIRAARTQAGLDLARLACALERFRLVHGDYPPTIDRLEPRFLASAPFDLADGKPLRYSRTPHGYRLYSVGWDLADDGGQPRSQEGQERGPDPLHGDWVWPELADQ